MNKESEPSLHQMMARLLAEMRTSQEKADAQAEGWHEKTEGSLKELKQDIRRNMEVLLEGLRSCG
jgi:hypothetical protein